LRATWYIQDVNGMAVPISVPVFQHAKVHVLHQVFTELAIAGEPQEIAE
jgi:hypothetical protein